MNTTLLDAARRGDRRAFERLFSDSVPKLRGLLYRMVGNPSDVDDLAQQALLRAFESIDTFRGDSSPGTWLCAIGTRLAIDHLRARERWRTRAQVIFAAACLNSEALAGEVGAALTDPNFEYDVHEHIAYCFTCIGRSLPPEAQAALVLRDVLGLTNDEAAQAMGVSRSVLRHKLAAGREQMQETYAGLCALVNKEGACWQCAGLREAVPPERQGREVPSEVPWKRRLEIVREAPIDGGTAGMHRVFFRNTATQEQERRGDENVETQCGRPEEAGHEAET